MSLTGKACSLPIENKGKRLCMKYAFIIVRRMTKTKDEETRRKSQESSLIEEGKRPLFEIFRRISFAPAQLIAPQIQ